MIATPEELEKRLSQLKKAVPIRGLTRHPSLKKQISELPPELQSSTIKNTLAGEEIKQIISFPPQIHQGNRYVHKQAMWFTSSGMIQLLASIWSEQEPTIVYLKVNGLMYCKVTLILLIGFLEIVARGITTPTQLEVEFNTAAWGLLSTPIRQILEADNKRHRDITGIPFSQRRESAFEKLPLKFFNGARIHGVLPGRNWRKWSSNPLCGSGSWYYSEGTLSPILYCC